jgi:hypothetical protein
MILSKNREVREMPVHFTRVNLTKQGFTPHANRLQLHGIFNLKSSLVGTDNMYIIRNWLYEHCENRFYIGEYVHFINNVIVTDDVVGFEVPADATYFSLIKENLL